MNNISRFVTVIIAFMMVLSMVLMQTAAEEAPDVEVLSGDAFSSEEIAGVTDTTVVPEVQGEAVLVDADPASSDEISEDPIQVVADAAPSAEMTEDLVSPAAGEDTFSPATAAEAAPAVIQLLDEDDVADIVMEEIVEEIVDALGDDLDARSNIKLTRTLQMVSLAIFQSLR